MNPTFVVSKHPKHSLCWFRNKLNRIKLVSKQMKQDKVSFVTWNMVVIKSILQ